MDFFNNTCQETTRTDQEFGICDDQKGLKAYTTTYNKESWIATVNNKDYIELIFTAIDKCILHDNETKGVERCDCMLTSNNHLFLIELKNGKGNEWKQKAVRQLLSTIDLIHEHHPNKLVEFKQKKAFACNRRIRKFQEIDQELKIIFFQKHKFRLDIQAKNLLVQDI